MKALYILPFCFVLLVTIYADENVEKAHTYVDNFIEQATKGSGAFIDPMPLETYNFTVEKKVLFEKIITAELKLYQGTVVGLSTLKRIGNCTCIDLDETLLVSCDMTFQKVKASYKGAAVINDIGPKYSAKISVGNTRVSLFIMVPAEGGEANLISLNIVKLKDIKVTVEGLPLGYNWITSFVTSRLLNIMEKKIAKVAAPKMSDYFSKEIQKYPFPAKEN